MSDAFVGIDVQVKRGCPFAVLDHGGRLIWHGWFSPVQSWREDLPRALAEARALVRSLAREGHAVAVGIDSPRRPLMQRRRWSCHGGTWLEKRGASGHGRHCEMVVKALGIANPQWTPPLEEAKDWMVLGFELFQTLGELTDVYEVFPSASYKLLAAEPESALEVSLPFESLAPGPKDFLDAVLAAFTVKAYREGRGAEVGGGDGYGTIVLPRALDETARRHPVHEWPEG